jgi:hypothetical protein
MVCLTLTNSQWIEAAFAVDPDMGGGAAEWAITSLAGSLAVTFGIFAGRDWQIILRERRAE